MLDKIISDKMTTANRPNTTSAQQLNPEGFEFRARSLPFHFRTLTLTKTYVRLPLIPISYGTFGVVLRKTEKIATWLGKCLLMPPTQKRCV